MRHFSTLASLVCCLFVLPVSTARAVPLNVFSSGANDIYRHAVTDSGSTIQTGAISTGASNPGKMIIGPDDELFVSIGAANAVNRYVDLEGAFIANPSNPTITSMANIDSPNGLRFRGNELFINNVDDNRISRYTFTGSGAAIAGSVSSFVTTTPDVTATRGRGVAFSPSGDRMYVTSCCSNSPDVVAVYEVDGAGLVTHLNNISQTDLSSGFSIDVGNAQAIAVSDSGELWLSDAGSSIDPSLADIVRMTLDGSGNLSAATVAITGSHINLERPLDLTFAPNGELFIANLGNVGDGDGFLSRFTFDGGGAILTTSQFAQGDSYRGVSVTLAPVPEPSSFLLLGLGALGLIRHTRRRRRKE